MQCYKKIPPGRLRSIKPTLTDRWAKLLGRGQTLPALTALEMGSIEYGSLHLSVLYVANAVLLVILFIVLGISYLLKRRLATHEN